MGSDSGHGPESGVLEPGDQVGDDYQVDRVLGRGGFGVVYEAHGVDGGGPVAIKILSLARDPDNVARFAAKARAADAIGHHAIVDLIGFGELDDGTAYVVNDLLRGEPLSAVLGREGRMQPMAVVTLLTEITSALGAAHQQGIAHLDLQPANVFMVEERGRSRPVILDFGMSLLLSEKDRVQGGRTGEVQGTPQFMAPEQTRGEEGDARSDIYALGAMAFQMLVGKPPFQGPNSFATLMLHLSAPIPSAHELNDRLPPAIDRAFERLLAKHPDERPETVAAALAVLRQALGLDDTPTGVGQGAAVG